MRFCLPTLLVSFVLTIGSASTTGIGCPSGSRPNGETVPEVSEAWCEVLHDGRTVLHGPYRAWWPSGKLGNAGQYEYGKAVGKWTAWYSNGKLQGEEWFENGVVVKARYFDERGNSVPQILNPTPPGPGQDVVKRKESKR